jgi:hypothetical protein
MHSAYYKIGFYRFSQYATLVAFRLSKIEGARHHQKIPTAIIFIGSTEFNQMYSTISESILLLSSDN